MLGFGEEGLGGTVRNGMSLAQATEAYGIARARKGGFVFGELQMIPRRVHHDFVARRVVDKTHEHLAGRFGVIDLHEVQRQLAFTKFCLQSFAQFVAANSAEQHAAAAIATERSEELMRLHSNIE